MMCRGHYREPEKWKYVPQKVNIEALKEIISQDCLKVSWKRKSHVGNVQI